MPFTINISCQVILEYEGESIFESKTMFKAGFNNQFACTIYKTV